MGLYERLFCEGGALQLMVMAGGESVTMSDSGR